MKTTSKSSNQVKPELEATQQESSATSGPPLQKIGTCLWFDTRAEEAANFYVSVFKNSKITGVSRYGEAAAKASGQPAGSVMIATFQLEGRDFMALNGGPLFTFSPAVSFIVNCESQEEVDYFWEKLSDGGEPGQCGWLTDKFGVSWQIVPTALGEMMKGGNARKSEQVMKVLIQMKRIDIKQLREAYDTE